MIDALIAIALLAGNAFFVAVEFSIARVRPSMVDDLVADGVRGAGALRHAVDNIDNYLSACQLGITICSIGLGITAEPLLSDALEDAFGEGRLLGLSGATLAFVFAYALVSTAHVVLGELSPKSLAIARTRRTGLVLMGPMRLFYVVTRPVVDSFNYLGNLVLRPFGIPPASEALAEPHSEEELKALIAESERRGLLDPEEVEFAEGVFSFGDRRAREVMVPRTEVEALSADQGLREATARAARTGHRRLPLVEAGGDLDGPLGIIHLNDLAGALADDGESETTLVQLAREALEIPDAILLDDLLERMRDEQQELAIVRDEHGTTVGVITMEDVIEQILGDIRDEFDPPRSTAYERTEEGVRTDGEVRTETLARELGLELGGSRTATIGGWLVEQVGSAPAEGEVVAISGFRFEVLARDGARITRLLISRAPAEEADPPHAG